MNFHVQASFVNLEKSSFDPFLLFNLRGILELQNHWVRCSGLVCGTLSSLGHDARWKL